MSLSMRKVDCPSQLEQVPQQQIAEMLDLSHANVRVRIHRIKDQLTTLLAQQQID